MSMVIYSANGETRGYVTGHFIRCGEWNIKHVLSVNSGVKCKKYYRWLSDQFSIKIFLHILTFVTDLSSAITLSMFSESVSHTKISGGPTYCSSVNA